MSEKLIMRLHPRIQEQEIKEGLVYEAIMELFSYLDRHYGGINGYLQTIGMTKVQIERLQSILVN